MRWLALLVFFVLWLPGFFSQEEGGEEAVPAPVAVDSNALAVSPPADANQSLPPGQAAASLEKPGLLDPLFSSFTLSIVAVLVFAAATLYFIRSDPELWRPKA